MFQLKGLLHHSINLDMYRQTVVCGGCGFMYQGYHPLIMKLMWMYHTIKWEGE